MLPKERINIGVSSCLLGETVRYDGGHKRNRYITDSLSDYFNYVSFCPEVAIGLGVPRPVIRLIKDGDQVRAVMPDDNNRDLTDDLYSYGKNIGGNIEHLSGYIFKSKSPSCGMERVKVYGKKGIPGETDTGIYANAIMQTQPLLPVEEEGRLNDPGLRDNFIERVLAYHRWQIMMKSGLTPASFIRYHSEHKFLIMAHNQEAGRKLGRLTANLKTNLPDIAATYINLFMQTLKKPTTKKNQVNVLQHMMGYLRKVIDKTDKQELMDSIDAYRDSEVPIIVPLTLIRHHLNKNPGLFIEKQKFLEQRPAILNTRR